MVAVARAPAGALNPIGRLGWYAWRTLTSVRFAVLQIIVLSAAGVVGAVLKQLPAYSLYNAAGYAREMETIRTTYDRTMLLGVNIGPQMVDLFERLGFFRVFSAPWFVFLLTLLVVSIVCCTLNRTPDLWRKAHNVNVVQPAAFFDLRLEDRARQMHSDDATLNQFASALKHHRFKVREAIAAESGDQPAIRHVYGDKNQYVKLATLFTHLGLILFLAGAAVTTMLGYETVVFLGEGETAPVQPVGTPDNLLVKNIHFEAPTRPDGSFADFSTDLEVYLNGQQIARKMIRVNDPLEVNGYTFHQNTFGPAEDLAIWDPDGRLVWDGPVLLTGALMGRPQGLMTIPGSSVVLLLVLTKTADGIGVLTVTGLGPTVSPNDSNLLFAAALGLGQASEPYTTVGYTIGWKSAGAYTGMVIKRDPGQGLIWVAYLSLIIGLIVTFYFPRRRVWARLEGDRLELAFLADRYVNTERELAQLLQELAVVSGHSFTAATA
ncbi:MAG: cytochrome c biogenesis protein ResB [Chloroflexota bacterium]